MKFAEKYVSTCDFKNSYTPEYTSIRQKCSDTIFPNVLNRH